MRSASQFSRFEDAIFARKWRLPFATRRQMACYGALQEAATFLAYKAQKDQAIRDGDKVLEAIFALVSRDEAAHAGFYREIAPARLRISHWWWRISRCRARD
jgi:acyl-[acyl-carrier-protein] desaturase